MHSNSLRDCARKLKCKLENFGGVNVVVKEKFIGRAGRFYVNRKRRGVWGSKIW